MMRHALSNQRSLAFSSSLLCASLLCKLLHLLPISFSPLSISLGAQPLIVFHRKSHMAVWCHGGRVVIQGQLMAGRLVQYVSVQQQVQGPPHPRELSNIVTVS